MDFSAASYVNHPRASEIAKYETRATMLFLVVCCLEISDILFAVDSVSAIVGILNCLNPTHEHSKV